MTMTMLDTKYWLDTDTTTGLAVIKVTGRCTSDEAKGIETGCVRRFEMVTLPHANGAILKSLDGTVPKVVPVTPPTIGRIYRCVKVGGRTRPFAYRQPAGPYVNKTILSYEIIYQEVGGVA